MRTGDHQRDLDRRPPVRAAKSGEQMPDPERRPLAPLLLESLRLVEMPANPDDKDRRDEADRKQHPPGDRLGQKGIERRVDERRHTPAYGPSGLHQPDRAAAVFVADHLAHQHRAGGPFAAKAKTVQRAQDEELLEILGEGAQKGENRIPQDCDLQHAHSAEAVGQGSRKPPAQRRDQQGDSADQPGLAVRQRPQRDHRRDDKAVHLHVERIERPAAKAGGHRAPFLGGQIAEPGKHCVSPSWIFAAQVRRDIAATPIAGPRS